MNKSIVMVLISVSMLCAQSLQELYREAEHSPLYQSRAESIDSRSAIAAAERYAEDWSVGADLAGAYPKDGSGSGGEFALSVGREFSLERSALGRFLRHNEAYAEIGKRVELNRIKGRLFRLYGEYCIETEAMDAQKHLAAIYKEMLKQIDKGVRFGEFDASKALMAHLALENLNLKIVETNSRIRWLKGEISSIVFFDGEAVCRVGDFDLKYLLDPRNSAYQFMMKLKKERSKEGLALRSSRMPKIGVNASYSDEIDTRRATLGLVIPLSFGNRSEAERAAAMHAYAAAKSEAEALERAFESASSALNSRLTLYNSKVKVFESSINLTTDTLIEQSRMRFKAGEESLLSMLKATETKLQMIEILIALKTKRLDAVAEFIDTYAIDPEGVTR